MNAIGTGTSGNETQVISVRYWASARSAAGLDSEDLPAPEPTTLTDVRRQLASRHTDGGRLAAVLDVCSVLVGDRPVSSEHPDDVVIAPGSTLEFLPPFAGG